MGTKRPATDVHPSRREQVPSAAKKRKTNPHPNRTLQPKTHPLNPIKSRIRSLQRLLSHKDNLPADVKLNHERELASCAWELEEARRAEKRKEMIEKYHMVRFFDRQKCARRLKQAKRKLRDCDGDGGEKERLGEEVDDAEVDLNYSLFFPLDMAYSALYPTGGKKSKSQEEEVGKERKGDPDMWLLVRKCMEEGKLDALRSGKLLKGVAAVQTDDAFAGAFKKEESGKRKAKDAKGKKQKAVEQEAAREEDAESEDGFFE